MMIRIVGYNTTDFSMFLGNPELGLQYVCRLVRKEFNLPNVLRFQPVSAVPVKDTTYLLLQVISKRPQEFCGEGNPKPSK